MSIPCKFERSILSYDEHEITLRSHHPEIYDASLDDLRALRQRLREMRDKERTLARENRRAVRGKGAQRAPSFPGQAEPPLRRKQVSAAALNRVTREIDRIHKLEARTALSKRPAALSPCAVRLNFLLARRPVTRRAKACGRCPVDGGVHEFPLQKSEACRKRQKTRKRGATPATALSSNQGECNVLLRRGLHFPQFPGRRLRRVHVRPMVLAAHHRHWRSVPASRHIRLGQGDLGDSADRVPLSCDIRVHDHSVEGHGRAKQPAGSTVTR